ncbi:MAG TPA: cytochrome c-type biogenesis protein CcmH [Thermoanaerobaculia bacterium]|nr:cytochrome c-type biogenesis protein CcmH [Thermoanaerobaculia bacterium]
MKMRIVAVIIAAMATLALFAQNAALKVPDAQQFVGAPQGQPLSGDALHRRTGEVASLLRCPVCQGLSVADSPSEMAVNMKEQVNELLARGYTEEQILKYFELSYGQFVLLKPKFEGMNVLVWVLPLAALGLGIGIVFMKLRSLENGPAEAPISDAAAIEGDAPVDPYLARVRDLVSGEKS